MNFMVLEKQNTAQSLAKLDRFGSEEKLIKHSKDMVRQATALARKSGVITMAPCEVCFKPIQTNGCFSSIVGHHDNYNEPLSVRWLCVAHHREWHRSNATVELTPNFLGKTMMFFFNLGISQLLQDDRHAQHVLSLGYKAKAAHPKFL